MTSPDDATLERMARAFHAAAYPADVEGRNFVTWSGLPRSQQIAWTRAMKAALTAQGVGVSEAPGHTDLMVSPESIDAFLEANPPPADGPLEGHEGQRTVEVPPLTEDQRAYLDKTLMARSPSARDLGTVIGPGAFDRDPRQPPRPVDGWAQPGDEPHRAFILRFSDPDMREQVFLGEGAETDAWAAYRLYAPTYNVYLFGTMPLPAPPGAE